MVDLDKIQSSNDQISTSYPEGLVAVFAGATAGIGETSLREFTRHTPKPRIYIIGRSQEACSRLDADLKQVNPAGQYVFIRSDVSLLRNVDDVCRQISSKETAINVLFMSQGTLNFNKSKHSPFLHLSPFASFFTNAHPETEEGLSYLMGLTYFGRVRMARNLLPLLQQATGLRRVVSSFTGAKEGKLYEDDWQGSKGKVPMTAARGHASTMMTLGLEALGKEAPKVSFIHAFPGSVKRNLIRGDEGAVMQAMSYLFKVMDVFRTNKYIPIEEVGERHTFYCTSSRFPPRNGDDGHGASGTPLPAGVGVARGVDGNVGSGVYSVDTHGESADAAVEEVLANFRRSGAAERLRAYTESEWKRVTGSVSV
ncbi:hypothetical protein VSDG_06763 [Cytospora chrysosperma]|uniref:Ketoreductase (KR) domain-containing protein n=1 Tax=Cytospora chrysosperma TaxID=252740 RepID=A0A423VR50_CYTCH|nr:hypothetical protein VSDG_06763 [Valsa sordida]